ncbi:xanthine dehydrogenase accessory protein XdhC [Ramlibacter sp. AN1015]|uniref:xanthine dehydrogenase accessory protein XdhC n=1 Tax=Ramlibacter sp. AN1015 TaxID=3133428 RepID=UPI0030C1AED6
MNDLLSPRLPELLARQPAVQVRVARTEGSAPRGAGTVMLVFPREVFGTIGGGQLEFQAIEQARERLRGTAPADAEPVRYPLGPSLGQCCGGVVWLAYERIEPTGAAAWIDQLQGAQQPVALFGGGHVGRALVRVLATLPFRITWIDSRDEIFPPGLPPQVRCEQSDPVQAAVADLPAGALVLIMSFSHAEDLDIVAACLRRRRERADLPFVGLIGSRTKWATFRSRLRQRGFDDGELAGVTCPIGIPGIRGKEPEVIAVSVAAQLLQRQAGAEAA